MSSFRKKSGIALAVAFASSLFMASAAEATNIWISPYFTGPVTSYDFSTCPTDGIFSGKKATTSEHQPGGCQYGFNGVRGWAGTATSSINWGNHDNWAQVTMTQNVSGYKIYYQYYTG